MAGLCLCVYTDRSFLPSTLRAPIYSSWRSAGDRANLFWVAQVHGDLLSFIPCLWQRPRSDSWASAGKGHVHGSSLLSSSGQNYFSLLKQQSVAWARPSIFLSELFLPESRVLTVCGFASWSCTVTDLTVASPVQGVQKMGVQIGLTGHKGYLDSF